MATGFQWIELGLKYSKTVASIFLFLLSISGYGFYDYVETKKNNAIHEVATGFQSVITEIEQKKEVNKVVVKSNCSSECMAIINQKISNHEHGRLH